jgi:tetratricopeptide (TPR) repeat protein
VYRWYSITRADASGNVVMDDETRGFARRIANDFHEARWLCPTFGPSLSVAGQIEMSVLNDAAGEHHIEMGYELAKSHPSACLAAGLLDANRGRWEASRVKFSHAVLLGHSLDEVIEIYVRQLDRPQLAMEIAAGNVQGMFRIAEILEQMRTHSDIAETARAEGVNLLRQHAAGVNATALDLAEMGRLLCEEKNYVSAAEYYRRALAKEYGRVDWHYALAKVLATSGATEDAMREARVCLRLKPMMPEARKLVEELSVKSGAARAN